MLVRRDFLRLTLALAVTLPAGCATPRTCPALPPAPAKREPSGPATVVVGTGSAALSLSLRDDSGQPVADRSVLVRCSCLSQPLRLTSDAHGKVGAERLPAGKYVVEVAASWSATTSVALELHNGAELWRNVRVQRWALQPKPRRPRDVLPDDVVLRLRSSSCLGTCVPYTLELFADSRVRLSQADDTQTWRIGHAARRRAVHRTQCLANGPSYDAMMATDAHTWAAEVVDGDAVASYEHYFHDFRATRPRTRFERSIERTLGVRGRRPPTSGVRGPRSSREVLDGVRESTQPS